MPLRPVPSDLGILAGGSLVSAWYFVASLTSRVWPGDFGVLTFDGFAIPMR